MARTKSTARRTGKGPNLASKAAQKKGRKQKNPQHIVKKGRARRYGTHSKVLTEIRRLQKVVEMTTPKLPFRRLVRSICENWDMMVKWRLSSLLALQEAAEDFIMEYFNDMCVLAAHTRRVTIQIKDSDTLKRLRWRYDKLLHPTDFIDPKMRDILLIPPYRKPKSTVKIVDITHEVNTRKKAEQDAEIQAMHSRRKEDVARKAAKEEFNRRYILETTQYHDENMDHLRTIRKGLDIIIPLEDGQRQLSLDMLDVEILMERTSHITDSILYVSLNIIKYHLPPECHSEIFILSSQMAPFLRLNTTSEATIQKWFTFCPILEVTTVLFPYQSRHHWSLVCIEIDKRAVWTLNSAPGTHGEIRLCIKRLLAALGDLFDDAELSNAEAKEVEVSVQKDTFSCGWRTMINAEYILQNLFCGEPLISKTGVRRYNDTYVDRYRVTMIKDIIHLSSEKTDEARFHDDDDIEVILANEEMMQGEQHKKQGEAQENEEDAKKHRDLQKEGEQQENEQGEQHKKQGEAQENEEEAKKQGEQDNQEAKKEGEPENEQGEQHKQGEQDNEEAKKEGEPENKQGAQHKTKKRRSKGTSRKRKPENEDDKKKPENEDEEAKQRDLQNEDDKKKYGEHQEERENDEHLNEESTEQTEENKIPEPMDVLGESDPINVSSEFGAV